MAEPPSTLQDSGAGPATIEVIATRALRQVQASIAQVLSSVPGQTGRAHEIEKTLGLHKTLAWKLAQLTESDDPVTIYQRIPGAAAIAKVLDAAGRLGVDARDLERVRSRVAELGAIVDEHAGDPETFVMMLSRFGRDHQRDTELRYRKQGFLATSYLCGIQADTILRSVIVNRTETDDMDVAVIFGCRDLVRLRADIAWVINRWRPTDDLGQPIPVTRQPIEDGSDGSPPLLSLTGPPRQQVRRQVLEDGTVEEEIGTGPVGRFGAVTFYTGEVLRAMMSRYRTDSSFILAQNLEVRTPCRTVIFDHLVHKDLFGRVEPDLRVYGELAGRPLWSNVRSDRDRLTVFEKVEYRGRGPSVLATTDAPEYAGLVRRSCSRLGWDLSGFDLYRLRMSYPYVPTTITYSYPLPEHP
jgi:hypothetical protein